MAEFLKKASLILIFPSVVFVAAALPLGCSLSKDVGVYKSQDSGATWQQKVTISKKENIAGKDILSMAQDTINSEILFIGTKGSGLYKSLDGADTWQQVVDKNNVLQISDDVYDIAISGKNPSLIYLAIYGSGFGRVLRSQDGSQSWEEIYVISQGGILVNRVAVDSLVDAIIYVGTAQGGFLKSIDYGLSWQPLKWFAGGVSDIKIDRRNNQIIYINIPGRGIYKSSDQGQNWQLLAGSMKNFIGNDQIGALLIDRLDSKILYTSLKDTLLISYDQGQTWQKINILIPAGSVKISTLAQDPQNSQILYYSAGSVLYKTINYGQTWTTYQIPSSKKINLILIDQMSPDIIYVGMRS